MADISKIKTLDGTTYDIKDATARNGIPSASSAAPGKVASSSSQGSSTNYARQDHTHGIDLATGDSNGQVKIAGTNVSVKGLGSFAYYSYLNYLGFSVGYCTTAESTTEKQVTDTNFQKQFGGIISVRFQNAVPAGSTLKIGSTSAAPIYHRGLQIQSNVIKAGDTAVFVYGLITGINAAYHLISIDSGASLPNTVSSLISNLESTIIQIDVPSFSSLPVTVTDSAISNAHVVLRETLSNPSAQTSDWTVTTAEGSLTISGGISGSTEVSLILGIPWNNVSADLF